MAAQHSTSCLALMRSQELWPCLSKTASCLVRLDRTVQITRSQIQKMPCINTNIAAKTLTACYTPLPACQSTPECTCHILCKTSYNTATRQQAHNRSRYIAYVSAKLITICTRTQLTARYRLGTYTIYRQYAVCSIVNLPSMQES